MFDSKPMRKNAKRQQRGATMPEMALGGLIFFMILFSILEFSRALTAYNALGEAVRRGARYAMTQPGPATDPAVIGRIRNMVMYGKTTAVGDPAALGLTTANIVIRHSPDFGLASGTVKVGVVNYSFRLFIPMKGTSLNNALIMSPFWAATSAESGGIVPGGI